VFRDLLHARELGKQDPRQPQVPPILLLREWGAVAGETAEDLFHSSLERAINDLQRIAEKIDVESLKQLTLDDYRVLSSTPRGETFFDHLVNLCDMAGGMILIFDQFEEVLRAGEEFADEAVEIIVKLYRFERRARLLLSLRGEQLKYLHSLESFVQGLLNRTYFLLPMRAQTVEEAIQSSARAASIQLDKATAATILEWLRQLGVRTLQARAELPTGVEGKTADEPVDLLTLQTILRELFELCQERQQGKGASPDTLVIDADFLEGYRNGRSTDVLVGEALERWIARALTPQAAGRPEDSAGVIAALPQDKLMGTVRRVAARMAPFLSSGGYKVAAEELDLMWGALRRDFVRLRPGIERVPRYLWRVEGTPPRLHRESLGLAEQYNDDTKESLSGLARERQWSPADTADYLVAVYYETLRRLNVSNILKRISVRKETIWELVHDGLGRPFINWAEKQVGTWEDCVFSPTVCRGEDIFIVQHQREQTISHACWQGCWIELLEGAVFEEVVFAECDLRGTVFAYCTFKGGGFKECILNGALFIDCHFERGPGGNPVIFEGCKETSGLTFRISEGPGAGSSIETMRFESCQLNGMGMMGIRLNDTVHFGKDTYLFQAHFEKLAAGDAGTGRARLEFVDGCKLEYCAWDEDSERLMDFRGSKTYGSGLQR
jgi:hypothetical protein